MRSSLDWKTLAGSLALLLAFLLSVPGVQAVRAAERAAVAAGSDGPVCTQPNPEAQLALAGPVYEQIRDQIAAQLGPAAADAPIVLNNRGYNYARGNGLEHTVVDLERIRPAR